jgi:hypothetical protein
MSVIVLRRMIALGGFPDFSYSGAHTIVDTGAESGEWKIALTGSGKLMINKNIGKANIQAQGGGGGGGASNGATSGSDGQDGAIMSLDNQSLEAGTYVISIGAAGSRGYNSAGYTGGATKFGDILTANGGAGGARAGGNRNQAHTSIYSSYGKGGLGGTTGQYSGSATYKYVYTASKLTYLYDRPSSINGQNAGTLYAGNTVYLASNTQYSSTDGSSDKWYKTESGAYAPVSNGSVQYKLISDTRSWYGVAGTAGVILLSGKA